MKKQTPGKRKQEDKDNPKTDPFAKFKKQNPAPRSRFKEERPASSEKRFVKRSKPESSFNRRNAPAEPVQEAFPLNKYLAHAGVCARRKAVEHIKAGEVKVNNKIIQEPGFKVYPKDKVAFRGRILHLQHKLEYLLLNKPKNCLTTTKDPRGRRTVMELIHPATEERVYPVGRLDRNTCGLLLLTNDGDLAQQLAHPSGKVKKVYHVTLNKPLTKKDFDQILSGVELEDGKMAADALAFVDSNDNTQLGLEIHSGRNRIVRRVFEHLGYEVKQLDRVLYAGLTKKNLPRGKWRRLSEREINILKHFTLSKKTKPAKTKN